MVDEERVGRLLDRVAEDVSMLRRYRDNHDDLSTDLTVLAAVKYHFITSIEGCARVAHHIATAKNWPVAESNADAVRRLATNGLIERDVADAVAKAVGFRNVLIHEYADVDDKHVLNNLNRVGDLEQFASQLADWLDSQ